MEKLIEILSSVRQDIDFLNENKLIDNGIIDSFDLIAIVGELNEFYNVNIGVAELNPENFNSAQAILKLIEELKK
ncbi:MAG: D-alanine--poly(phosphoribitol) ligase subunit 2 [Bacteroidales bacterium]|nr:D-alanine--poly(phosphoribitol) ligase subunit 2 [Bacteroidales bacterium]